MQFAMRLMCHCNCVVDQTKTLATSHHRRPEHVSARSRPTTSSQELAPPHSSPRLGGRQPSGLRFPDLQRFVPPGCDDASRYTMHASYHLRCTSSIFRLRSWAVQDRNKPRSRFVECVTRGSNAAASARPTMEPLSRACLLCVNPLIS